MTQEQYDSAHDHINPDRTSPKGLVFHASGPIDGGWGIIDFWESRADFDAFSVRIRRASAAGIEMQEFRSRTVKGSEGGGQGLGPAGPCLTGAATPPFELDHPCRSAPHGSAVPFSRRRRA